MATTNSGNAVTYKFIALTFAGVVLAGAGWFIRDQQTNIVENRARIQALEIALSAMGTTLQQQVAQGVRIETKLDLYLEATNAP
jgi:hypothetical protein